MLPPSRIRAARPRRGRPGRHDAIAKHGHLAGERGVGWLAVQYAQTLKLAFLIPYLRLLR